MIELLKDIDSTTILSLASHFMVTSLIYRKDAELEGICERQTFLPLVVQQDVSHKFSTFPFQFTSCYSITMPPIAASETRKVTI